MFSNDTVYTMCPLFSYLSSDGCLCPSGFKSVLWGLISHFDKNVQTRNGLCSVFRGWQFSELCPQKHDPVSVSMILTISYRYQFAIFKIIKLIWMSLNIPSRLCVQISQRYHFPIVNHRNHWAFICDINWIIFDVNMDGISEIARINNWIYQKLWCWDILL